ncbi:hypothetical protein RQP46_007234 [Phenoliferia psychrophenolica]
MPARKGIGKLAMVFACGSALFSDGYQNGVVGEINTILARLYPDSYTQNSYSVLFNSMGFAGTVVGMLVFGYLADRIGRKFGMIAATLIVAVFTLLAASAYGAGGSTTGMLQALIAYRFLTGIGIGAEYPAGSVACSESTEDPGITKGRQHLLFALATNSMIDWGFVIAAFVPWLLLYVCGESDRALHYVWRAAFGVGVVPPVLVLFWRFKMAEPLRFQKESMKNTTTPYWLIFKRYWRSFLGLSLAWFIYDFIAYPFGIYSSTIVYTIIGKTTDLKTTFGWNIVINLFYIPGTVGGAFIVDRVGPRRLMISMLLTQAVVGFIMSGLYTQLSSHIAAFAVVYGLFLTFGEAGPGNCLGLLASKSWPTAIRGQAYGLAAAIGKIGAFCGTWAFPAIIKAFPKGKKDSGPFWVGSGLAVLSAIIVYFLLDEIPEDHMTNEDQAFREYLEANKYDTSLMGLRPDQINGGKELESQSEDEKASQDVKA